MYEYDLFAVINHEGQMDNGHYTNFARFRDEVRLFFSVGVPLLKRTQWYRFDDDRCVFACRSDGMTDDDTIRSPIFIDTFTAG
jgi:ubiquitin C-terminal hydrolase